MQQYRYPPPAPRRSSRGFLLPVGIVAALVAGWTGFWFYSAGKAETVIAGWLEREAQLGRVYGCGSREISGFPFRFEVRCRNVSAQLHSAPRPWSASLPDAIVVAQIWEPTALIGEFSGPFTITDIGEGASVAADWSLAQASVRGTPRTPQRISVAIDDLAVDQIRGNASERLVAGKHVELHSRLAEGALNDKPVIDFAARVVATAAPGLHPFLRDPTDLDLETTLRGLKDLAAKPWSERFREIRRVNGRIDVRNVRIRQGEWLAVANGSLGLTAQGGLQGELRVTVVALDKLLNSLGVQYLAQQPETNAQINSALNALDRVMPGLGGFVRERAGAGVAAGLSTLGEPTELEGRKAVRLPLRFDDGTVSLGPIPLGVAPRLF
jgi:hypothetical protein